MLWYPPERHHQLHHNLQSMTTCIAKRLACSMLVAVLIIWARQHSSSNSVKVSFTTALAPPTPELLQMGHIPIHGKYVNQDSMLCCIVRCRIHAAVMFGIFFLLRKIEYIATQDPPQLATGGRFLRQQMLAFYDSNKVKIQYDKVSQVKAPSSRTVLQFSKQTPQAKDELLSIVTNPKVQAFVSSPWWKHGSPGKQYLTWWKLHATS